MKTNTYKRNIRKQKSKKPLLLVGIASVAVLALIGFGSYKWLQSKDDSPAETTTGETISDPETKLDLSPPTEQDKQAVDEHKHELTEQQEQQNQGQAANIKPIIISAYFDTAQQLVSIRSFVPGITEENGNCTITLTKDGATITKTAAATRNAQSTDCAPTTIPRSEFGQPGDWKVAVTYKSANSSGTSDEATVKIE